MTDSAARSRATLVICAAAALLEGFDNQSVGVAAPMLIKELSLSTSQSGWIFSAGTLGAIAGALLGGRMADSLGRKWALIVSLFAFGLASLATAVAPTALALFICRLATGVGLGGAMPNFITLASEAVRIELRLRTATLIMATLPLGGALAAVAAASTGLGWSWRAIFYLGGVLPIVIALCGMVTLPNDHRNKHESAPQLINDRSKESFVAILFGRARWLTTLLLWVSFFFTQLILLLMLNWLPSLLVKSGFTVVEASWLSVCFGASGALGSLVIGYLQSGKQRKLWVTVTYLGMGAALAGVGSAHHELWIAILTCAAAGAFIVGAQLVLFGLAPLYYPRAVRGSGVGSAVAFGRLGSVAGPLFAAAALAGGGNTATVLLGVEPFVLLSGAAALALCWRPQVRD